MTSPEKRKLDFLIAEEAFAQRGRFEVQDIYDRIANKFKDIVENLKVYIKKKLDILCDMGLIGKTRVYYFPL